MQPGTGLSTVSTLVSPHAKSRGISTFPFRTLPTINVHIPAGPRGLKYISCGSTFTARRVRASAQREGSGSGRSREHDAGLVDAAHGFGLGSEDLLDDGEGRFRWAAVGALGRVHR